MGFDNILNLSKKDLESLEWEEENGDEQSLEKNEIGEIRNLIQHIEYLKQEGGLPSEASKFRHNTITRESYINYKGSRIGTKML